MKHICFLVALALLLVCCDKTYTVKYVDLTASHYDGIEEKEHIREITAKDDQEAQRQAYDGYIMSVVSFCAEPDKDKKSYMRIPTDYYIYDNSGRSISKGLTNPIFNVIDSVAMEYINDSYREWLGIRRYNATPYGMRHPYRL